MDQTIHSLDELATETARLVNTLSPKDSSATLITLSGELGAGKTTFTQALAKMLGVEEPITSPTFVLEKIYTLRIGDFTRLVHIDAYRLTTGDDLAALGFDELMRDPRNLVVLEWPERVAGALPKPDVAMRLDVLADGTRRLRW